MPFRPRAPRNPSAFTLIELLVVVAIIAIIISILLPSLGRARERAKTTRCLANLKSIGTGLVVYQTSNDNYVVPSYNMVGYGTGAQTVDGWPAILDRDGITPTWQSLTSNVFVCPNQLDLPGMTGGQTANDLNKPNGYQDWPTTFLNGGDSGGQADPALPVANFGNSNGLYTHNIRCGYFLNASNPIGNPAANVPCPYYTQSVGYLFSDGTTMPLVRATAFTRPSALIVACDGVYMGRQSVSRLGQANRRIGYRHAGPSLTFTNSGASISTDRTLSNAVFADGHAESIFNNDFPLATSSSNDPALVRDSNQANYTIYANPESSLP